MKKIVLSIAAVATAAMAGGDITPVEPVVEVASEKSFLDRVHFKGDLRLRYESIERDDADNTYRNRYRLRLGAKIDLIDNLQFEVGMRSGFANPTSGNQTFYDDENLNDYFFQSLRFNILGLAYTSGNSTYKVGRQPYMMYRPIKSQLVWDNDVSLNGVNYQYNDDTKIITVGANQVTLEEKAADAADDVNLFYAQYVHKTKLEFAKLNLGAGIYYYDGLQGNTTLFGSSKGNTLDANGLYENDYHIVEGFGELQFKDVFGKPFKIAASVAYNVDPDDNNFGYDLAFQLGKAKDINDWQVKYSYTDLEEDATYGAYSDSDNFGGGTAAKGHAIRAKYKAGKNLYLAGNFFFNELYESKSKIDGMEPDYTRVQLDMIYKF
ncbi:putative porin [Sulfurovum sp.]|uniref:putative porin n=1 Tax=Sulfurovum sp. TaxID=1969726 RepID=UPI0035667714